MNKEYNNIIEELNRLKSYIVSLKEKQENILAPIKSNKDFQLQNLNRNLYLENQNLKSQIKQQQEFENKFTSNFD